MKKKYTALNWVAGHAMGMAWLTYELGVETVWAVRDIIQPPPYKRAK